MVGTSILAPRPASQTVTGTRISMLSPSRRKNGCSATLVVMYRSPAVAPIVPALPLPGTRRREPVRAPGGIRISTCSFLATRPSPPQVGHELRSLPDPPQRGQVSEKRIAPAIWVTLPVPLHCGQVTSPAPEEPEPWP